jgi:hypothetical protein
MAIIKGYLNGEETYSKECLQSEVDTCIVEAFSTWGSIDDLENIVVEVEDDDGHCWSPW